METETVPSRKFTVLHAPIFGKTTAGIELRVNGVAGLQHAIHNKTMVQFTMRPEDPTCKPLFGDVTKELGLVAKLRVKKNAARPLQDGDVKLEILGSVSNSVKYVGLADFQFLPPPNYNKEKYTMKDFKSLQEFDHITADPGDTMAIDGEQATEDRSGEPLHIPPPVFSPLDHSRVYMFRHNPNTSHFFNKGLESAQNNQKFTQAGRGWYISQNQPTPTEPTELMQKSRLTVEDARWRAVIAAIFEVRPIWDTIALNRVLGRETSQPIGFNQKMALYWHCYSFTSGPFRLMWIKLGVDPRKDSSLSIYQNCEIRLRNPLLQTSARQNPIKQPLRPQKLAEKVSQSPEYFAHKAATEFPPAFSSLFEEKSAHKRYLELCWAHINEPQLQEMARATQPEYSLKTGWFTEHHLGRMRARVTHLFEQELTSLLQQKVDQETAINLAVSDAHPLGAEGEQSSESDNASEGGQEEEEEGGMVADEDEPEEDEEIAFSDNSKSGDSDHASGAEMSDVVESDDLAYE